MVERLRRRSARAAGRTRLGLEGLEDRLVPAPVTFFLIETDSFAALSGGITSPINVPLQQQGPGSLRTTYSGTMNADIVSGSSIRFDQAGTSLVAANSGNWQPGPSGSIVNPPVPANYGISANLFGQARAAIRGVAVTLFTAATQALTSVGTGVYTFPATQSLMTTAGTYALNHALLGGFSGSFGGATPLANASPDPGYLIDFGPLGIPDFYLIYLPIRVTVSVSIPSPPVQASLTIAGELLAIGLVLPPFQGGREAAPDAAALSYLATLSPAGSSVSVSVGAAPVASPANPTPAGWELFAGPVENLRSTTPK